MRLLKIPLNFHKPGEFVQYSIPKKCKFLGISRSLDDEVYLHLIYDDSSDKIQTIDLVGYDGSGSLPIDPALYYLDTVERQHKGGKETSYSLHVFCKQVLK